MEIGRYLKGQGIDVSKTQQIEKAKHFFKEPDNFYSLKDFAKPETFDFVYSKNTLNNTKFYRILIKEWFYACKVKGKIIIEIIPNSILNFSQMLNEIETLLVGKIKILERDYDPALKKGFVVIEKTLPSLEKKDSIDKWTFGILTNGKRDEAAEAEIESILALKIPHCEIIVCGAFRNKNKRKIKHIDFNPEIAWITKKKNMICEAAKYENIVVTHDRFIFDKDWFNGMKKYGNYFDLLSCVIKNPHGNRAEDWITFGTDLNSKVLTGKHGLLEYRDWDKNGYIDGGLYILKKSSWKKANWNNKLSWGEGEDIDLAKEYYNAGVVARFNPFSLCNTSSIKAKQFLFEFNNRELGRLIGETFSLKLRQALKRSKFRKHYFALRNGTKAFKETLRKYPNIKG